MMGLGGRHGGHRERLPGSFFLVLHVLGPVILGLPEGNIGVAREGSAHAFVCRPRGARSVSSVLSLDAADVSSAGYDVFELPHGLLLLQRGRHSRVLKQGQGLEVHRSHVLQQHSPKILFQLLPSKLFVSGCCVGFH